MTINVRYALLTSTLFFLMGLSAEAQNDSLRNYLNNLENRFDIRFSYADKILKEAKVDSFPFVDSIDENLKIFSRYSSLRFTKMGRVNYVIENFEPPLQPGITQKLEEVVLTNYLSKGITKKTTGTFYINSENLGILPGLIEPDALRSIQSLPGVESVNETVSNINVRGGTGDQNLILYDGIRMYQSAHFFGLISAFNPYQTQQDVSLTKNGTNPAFGNSVSSVIAMNTSKEVTSDTYGEVGVNYISAHTFLEVPLDDNQSIQFAARTSFNNLFRTPTYNKYYQRAFQNSEVISDENASVTNNQEFSFNDLSLKWLYKISENDRLRINFIRMANELNFQENALINDQLETRESELDQNNRGAGANYRHLWSEFFQTEIQLYFSNYELSAINSNIQQNDRTLQKNEILESSAKLNSLYEWNENFTWQNGYELIQTEVSDLQEMTTSLRPFFQTTEFFQQSVFSSLQFKSNDRRINFQAGLRFNIFNTIDDLRLEPRFSYNQRLNDQFSLEILGELKSQVTTQVRDYENDFLGLEKFHWTLADDQASPLTKSQQISLGFNYKEKQWFINLVGYLKKVQNISSQAQGFQNQYEFSNVVGSYFSRGADVLLQKGFDRFNFWLSYGFGMNDYTFDNLPVSVFPNNVELRHSATLAGTFTTGGFHASAGLKWRTGVPFTPLTATGIEQNRFDYQSPNSSNLKEYIRFDISANQSFALNKTLKAYAGISVWNLFNRKNIINAYYERQQGELQLIEQQALEITPNFVFRLKF